MEEEVANMHRDQELSDKNTGHQVKLIKIVREKIKVLEDKVSNTQNHMSGVLQEIMRYSLFLSLPLSSHHCIITFCNTRGRCSMSIDDQHVQLSELEITVTNLTSQLDTVNKVTIADLHHTFCVI